MRNNTTLAQQTFDNERRDFIRFLNQLQGLVVVDGSDVELQAELRKFIGMWLRIYSEAFKQEKLLEDLLASLNQCQNIEELLKQSRAILEQSFTWISDPMSEGLQQEVVGLQSLELPNFKKPCCTFCPGFYCKARCLCSVDEETIYCGFCHWEVLDSSHGLLVIALAVSSLLILILVALFLLTDRSSSHAWEAAWDIAPLALYTVCLLTILCRYEQVCALGRQQGQWQEEQHRAFTDLCADSLRIHIFILCAFLPRLIRFPKLFCWNRSCI